MPRILVADDNSNIQKMVTLALKDVGIDVVAVPNGEAAVRKLTDGNLDLVLADIFMPVRSGYEVCEFIKQDPRYLHLPVVLLVGAFDPLDEREAQRVGADGILKKPFVPPDPLINMVKSLLAKTASERLVAVSATTAGSAEASSVEAAPAHPPKREPELPRTIPAADFSDVSPDEFLPPVNRLDFEETSHPVAFNSLLETPAADDDDVADAGDLTVTASRDPVLGEPAFWAHPIADAAPNQTEETDDADALQDHDWGAHAQPLPFSIDTPTLPPASLEGTSQTEIPASPLDIAAEMKSVTATAATASDVSPNLSIEAATESETGRVHAFSIETEVEPEPAHTLDNLSTKYPESSIPAVEPDDEPTNLLEMPSIAAEDSTPGKHEISATQSVPGVEHFFPDLAAISAELSAIAPIRHTPAHQESSKTPESASEAPAAAEADSLESSALKRALAVPETLETATPSTEAAEATIDTQKVGAPEVGGITEDVTSGVTDKMGDIQEDAEPVAANGAAHLDAVPTLAEMPGWMASVATMFPPMESSLEAAAKAELNALSHEHGAISEVLLGEKRDSSTHEEREQASSEAAAEAQSGAASGAPSESAERSEPDLLTTAWPPAFEPELSDAELFERPVASASTFKIPGEPVEMAPPSPLSPETEPAVAALAAPSPNGNGAASVSAMQSPEMLEAIVTRIVERMQPQVIDVVTREILRPLVEALVRREMDKH